MILGNNWSTETYFYRFNELWKNRYLPFQRNNIQNKTRLIEKLETKTLWLENIILWLENNESPWGPPEDFDIQEQTALPRSKLLRFEKVFAKKDLAILLEIFT